MHVHMYAVDQCGEMLGWGACQESGSEVQKGVNGGGGPRNWNERVVTVSHFMEKIKRIQ